MQRLSTSTTFGFFLDTSKTDFKGDQRASTSLSQQQFRSTLLMAKRKKTILQSPEQANLTGSSKQFQGFSPDLPDDR
jgi:hypothetical protein